MEMVKESKVASLTDVETATVADALVWIAKRIARNDYRESTAAGWASALRSLTAIMDDDESRRAIDVLAALDDLRDRWARKNIGDADGETALRYHSRAKKLLEEYVRCLRDPSSFKPDSPRPTSEKKKAAPAVSVERTTKMREPMPAAPSGMRRLRLADGRYFEFVVPGDSLSVREVKLISLHLATLVDGLDPEWIVDALKNTGGGGPLQR